MIKQIIGKFFIPKKRKQLLEDMVVLICDVKKVSCQQEVSEALVKVVEFNRLVENPNDPIKHTLGQLVDYLSDTRDHINNGYHKPRHNGWKTVRTYPDINDYIDFGVKLKRS